MMKNSRSYNFQDTSAKGKYEDVANAVIFLASSGSDYINGETLHQVRMYMA